MKEKKKSDLAVLLGYAEKMEAVIHNVPMLIIMLVLTIPAAILGMRIAEKVLKKQADSLK